MSAITAGWERRKAETRGPPGRGPKYRLGPTWKLSPPPRSNPAASPGPGWPVQPEMRAFPGSLTAQADPGEGNVSSASKKTFDVDFLRNLSSPAFSAYLGFGAKFSKAEGETSQIRLRTPTALGRGEPGPEAGFPSTLRRRDALNRSQVPLVGYSRSSLGCQSLYTPKATGGEGPQVAEQG